MKQVKQYIIACVATLSAFTFWGCNDEQEIFDLPEQKVSEILFSGQGDDFVQEKNVYSRASNIHPISQDGKGPRYGTFYILQTIDEDDVTDLKPTWGLYKASSGTKEAFEFIGDNQQTSDGGDYVQLNWGDGRTSYLFRTLSVPPARIIKETITGDNQYTYEDETDNDPLKACVKLTTYANGTAEGEVKFGDYTTGLEYFVGTRKENTSMPTGQLPDGTDDRTLHLLYERQVCKVVFDKIIHISDGGVSSELQERQECDIIFPNLPAKATFTMDEFYDAGNKSNKPFVTFHDDFSEGPAQMTWINRYPNDQSQRNFYHAFYLPPFRFMDLAEGTTSGNPENRLGFFIIEYEGKTYTGNITGGEIDGDPHPQLNRLRPSQYCNLTISLVDGPEEGGGNGSIIVDWNTAGPEETDHHRVPGIYSQEDADELLEALKSGDGNNIPVTFYREETIDGVSGKVKVIRLFMNNIDWSEVITQLNIPDGFVLMGQGYNIKMGEGGSIEADQQKGNLYINEELYIDGVPQQTKK